MEVPLRSPNCFGSSLTPMNNISHSTTNFSRTLLKKGVREITLRSSSLSGSAVFWSGVPYSLFHEVGQFTAPFLALFTTLLKILETGAASSGPNSLISLSGRSPGTPDLGLLALLILSYTSYYFYFKKDHRAKCFLSAKT